MAKKTVYEQGHVKRNAKTGEVAIRTTFAEDQFPNMAWLVSSTNLGARNADQSDVDGWTTSTPRPRRSQTPPPPRSPCRLCSGTLAAQGPIGEKPSYAKVMGFTENGWPGLPATEDMLNWVTVPGTDPPVHLQIQKGQPTQILRAFVADMNAYIEPVYDADCACYTRENSVFTSNHRSGTACDIRWESHPFHVKGTFGGKLSALRELLDFYETTVFWGGDWTDPIDEMHFQMGYHTYNNEHTAGFIARKIRPDGFSTYKRGAVTAATKEEGPAVEKVLNWDKGITSQQYYWSCGPATTQILLSIRGIAVSEDELVRVVGATVNGTDAISQIELKALDRFCPEAQYTTVWLPNDPPTKEQVETFWKHLKVSIDNGYGVAQNWVAPPSNTPRPVHGSTDIPGFYKRGSTIYHYIAATGYAEDGSQRFVRIGDPGGQPNEYWVTLEQNVSLLTPKGYVWAAAFKEQPVAPPPVQAPPVQAPIQVQTPTVTPISLPAPVHLGMEVEWNAFLGETDAILAVLRAALSTDVVTKNRAIRVLKVVPKDALQAVAQALKG